MNARLARLSGTSLYLLSRLIHATCPQEIAGLDTFRTAVASGRPLVLAAWHGMTMMLVTTLLDELEPGRLTLPFPDDWRGVTLSTFVGKMGMQAFPMNLKAEESFSAARQLSHLIRLVRQGNLCYINPDGSDGPAYVPKPGVAFIARKAQAQILPLGAYARHAYRLNRWDTYTIPYPFARISVCVGQPLEAPPEGDLAPFLETLTDRLHRASAQARANYYERQPGA